MFIDALTITGFLSAASFALMPVLMGREFIRVETCDERSPSPATQRLEPRSPASSALADCV
jgi:hypothetical protein